MEENHITLSGIVVEAGVVRISPSGVPHYRCVMEHRSRQVEVGQAREVSFRIPVEFRGNPANDAARTLGVNARVSVTGFLDKSGFRDGESARLVLHAQHVQVTG